jgi:hypothetical protein
MSSHEPLQTHRAIVPGSNRAFGLVFAGVFLLTGLWPWVRYGAALRPWALAFAAVFLVVSLFAPERLAPLNRLWFRLGLALHVVVSPLIMGLLFYGAVTPTGLIMRAFGKDILGLRRNDGPTYWRDRDPPGPATGSMKNQF